MVGKWGLEEERRPTIVLVHEFVTGGGMIGRDLPASWAAEGTAMRRAIAADFASLQGVRVITTLDARLPGETSRHDVDVRIITDRPMARFEALAAEADRVVLIAPETGGTLADHARAIDRAGGHSLGSRPEAIDLVADKARLAAHFEARGIPTPPSRTFVPSEGIPADWPGPIVVKPVDGAGSLDTFVLSGPRRCPPDLLRHAIALAQPFCEGEPRSASFLIDRDGRPSLLAVGRQRIEVDAEGRVGYHGGTIPAGPGGDLAVIEDALASVPGLRGFVGVDFLHQGNGPSGVVGRAMPPHPNPPPQGGRVGVGGASSMPETEDVPSGRTLILEINPRPTTSFVGLARWLGPGVIAGAWLSASEGACRLPRPPRSSIMFDADGSIRPGASTR